MSIRQNTNGPSADPSANAMQYDTTKTVFGQLPVISQAVWITPQNKLAPTQEHSPPHQGRQKEMTDILHFPAPLSYRPNSVRMARLCSGVALRTASSTSRSSAVSSGSFGGSVPRSWPTDTPK